MSLSVQTNVSAMNTTRWLNTNQSSMESSLAKLSSGYQINTASDDPAGLVISEQLRSQIAGLNQAMSNTEEAMNVVGIAEGALNEMNSILISMNELAIHSANSGVTSSDQIVADQAEMDSAVQTIDRIAKTTTYSDTYLLNGSQEITYDTDTLVDSTEDNTLVDSDLSQIYQISSLDQSINISYSGEDSDGTADSQASSKRAYVEATSATAGVDIATNGTSISADLVFTITGANGSEEYSFGEGQELGTIAETINGDSESTGVAAQLIFDTAVTGVDQTTGFSSIPTTHASGQIGAYEMDKDYEQDTDYTISSASISDPTSVSVGENTDADGCVYLKFTSDTEYTIYKDAEMTMEVGTGSLGTESTESNNSGLNITVDVSGTVEASDVVKLQVGATTEVSTAGTTAGLEISSDSTTGAALESSALTGIRLGENTDENGNIYMKTIENEDGTITVNLYNDSSCDDSNLMATGTVADGDDTDQLVEVYAVTTSGDAGTTGLYGSLNIDTTAIDGTGSSSYSCTISASDLGIRLYSTEYGDDAFVTVEASEGALFTDDDDQLIDSTNDYTSYGQNGSVTVNGTEYELDEDLTATVSTTDLNASFVMEEGELGATTVAVQGYDEGALSSKGGAMDDDTNHATQAMSNTSETLEDLTGGMTLQVGESTTNDDSTVISIQSMTASDLGKVTITDDYDGDGIEEEKTLTLEDLQGGEAAALANDPDKAIAIIAQAIDDVSMTRARLGAVQSNLLQTNVNSLSVAVENITNTESAIRDTDMATESTNYTKNQILVQAATSMLAQANTIPQQALSLLG